MRLSGLVLDVYDDALGETVKTAFESPQDIPELIKDAHALSFEERGALPDDVFALVLTQNGETLRKYACTDAGNTALSVLYFREHGHKLPEEAQKIAEANLRTACGWYGLELESIKTAGVMRSLWNGAKSVGSNARGAVGAGVGLAKGIAGAAVAPITSTVGAARTIASPIKSLVNSPISTVMGAVQTHGALKNMGDEMKQNWQNYGPKVVLAEVNGTTDMPLSAKKGDPVPKSLTVVSKVAAAVPPAASAATPTKEQPGKNPQAKHLTPHVDISVQTPPKVLTEKKAERYALPGRYPLDSYDQVKTAGAYFEQFGRRMQPEERHQYCTNLVKRASELSIPMSEIVRKYGSEKYASSEEISAYLDIRRGVLTEDLHKTMLDKLAEARPFLQPELFCLTLSEFDKVAGIDHLYEGYVPDPYYSTFGAEKTAAEDEAEYSDAIGGNLFVTGRELGAFAQTGFMKVKGLFGEDFAVEFKKDPIGVYKSLPLDQKKMMIRMATENAPGVELSL